MLNTDPQISISAFLRFVGRFFYYKNQKRQNRKIDTRFWFLFFKNDEIEK
ncbi:hypothetical protein L248_2002 [Schleiferilactobacillus shenzhenensis LY-73]|uniref:Uncharacterized protein n=1 Tax=Schleiferilactobacillus shenzhenensis LY-73 TaxID=1231336 RepID=U4TM33_9LACO|nr:hypothetical protein L248_2002 [Schleiferilactobacillus shenzhenensis LY-73]